MNSEKLTFCDKRWLLLEKKKKSKKMKKSVTTKLITAKVDLCLRTKGNNPLGLARQSLINIEISGIASADNLLQNIIFKRIQPNS